MTAKLPWNIDHQSEDDELSSPDQASGQSSAPDGVDEPSWADTNQPFESALNQQPLAVHEVKLPSQLRNPKTAVLLSIIPTIGQVYNGQVGKYIALGGAYSLVFHIYGATGDVRVLWFAAALWVIGLYDAWVSARKINLTQIVNPRHPEMAVLLAAIAPGLGQIYNGQARRGIFIICTFWLIIPWFYGLFNAWSVARDLNEIPRKPRPTIVFVLICWMVLGASLTIAGSMGVLPWLGGDGMTAQMDIQPSPPAAGGSQFITLGSEADSFSEVGPDEIRLTNGNTMRGRVVGEDDVFIWLEIYGGTTRVNRKDIADVRKGAYSTSAPDTEGP